MRRREKARRAQRRAEAGRGHDPPKARTEGKPAEEETPPLCRETEGIRTWLKQVRFQKAAFGGVDEADVWRKIGTLNTLYEQALAAERMRYDALLEARLKQGEARPEKAGDVPYE